MSNEGASGVAAEGRFHVGEPARWVTGFKSPPPEAGVHTDESPTDQLLVDRQLFPRKSAHYSRHVQRANDAEGVESLSRVRFRFDPAIERLVVHSVRIWRDGVASEHADASRFELRRGGGDSARGSGDTRVSASMLLEDVRLGDVVDVAYTRIGDNPQLAGHFFTTFASDYPVPVSRWSASVLVEEGSRLRWRCTPEEVEPVSRELKGGWTLHRWSKGDLPACEFEPNTPGWHQQGSSVELSDFTDWGEVARWVAELWGRTEVPAELKPVALEIARENPDEAGRALSAVSFVREEIDDLGTEGGLHLSRPCPVADVLRRRSGDSRDRSRLLCLLLRMLKIPASPMLVNTVAGRAVAEMLPSPGAFDHVVVCAKIDGGPVWIDPARRGPATSVADLAAPACGVALPVSAKAKGLRRMPDTPPDAALLVVEETYAVKDLESPALLTVEQTATGHEAEHLREALALGEERYRALREAQLRQIYPQAKAVGDWAVDAGAESPSTREHFVVPDFIRGGDDGGHTISFAASSIEGRLAGAPDDSREAPWALPYPCRIRHETHIESPSPIACPDDSHRVDSETFGYRYSLSVDGDGAHAVFRYWSKSDHVRPDQLGAYRDDYRELLEHGEVELPLGGPGDVELPLAATGGAGELAREAPAPAPETRKRRSGSSRARHHDAKRKKLIHVFGTIGVVAVVVAVFASVKDPGKIPEPAPSGSRPEIVDSAAFQAIYGNGGEGQGLSLGGDGDGAPAGGVPDATAPGDGDGFLPLGDNPATGTSGDEIKASLLDFGDLEESDQPEDPKLQNLRDLDVKL